MERDIDLRLQSEDGGVGHVAEADGGPVGLGKAELNFFPGDRVPRLLVKEQVRGGEVDRVFQLLRRCLVGMNDAFRIGFQVHLDLALADYVAGLRIVFKIRAVDLVEAAGIAPVQRDGDVMQFGVSACLYCTALLASILNMVCPCSERETVKPLALCWISIPIFAGTSLSAFSTLLTGVEIHRRHHQQEADGAPRKPAPKVGNLDGHLETSLLEANANHVGTAALGCPGGQLAEPSPGATDYRMNFALVGQPRRGCRHVSGGGYIRHRLNSMTP